MSNPFLSAMASAASRAVVTASTGMTSYVNLVKKA